MKLAHSIQLSPDEVKQALRAYALAKAKQRSLVVPDPAFAEQLCEVHLLRPGNVAVDDLALASVTWVSS